MTGGVMEEYRQLLDGAVGAPPPSTVDIDRVVRAGRRGERARAAAVLAGTAMLATAVLAGAAVLVVAARPAQTTVTVPPAMRAGAPASTTVAPTVRTQTPTPSYRALPPVGVPRAPDYPPAADGVPDWPTWMTWPISAGSVPGYDGGALPRLSQTLRGEIRKLPGSVVVKAPGGESRFVFTDGVGYTAKLLIAHDGLYGWMLIRVSGYDDPPCLAVTTRDSNATQPPCPPQYGPRGESVYRWIGPMGRVADFGFNVVVRRPDGTQVSLSAIGADEAGRITDRILPLTMNELVQIGIDPQFSLHG